MLNLQTCAVIPAAGRGSRLGAKVPKLLVQLTPTKTIWSVLRDKLQANAVDHIHVIVSPAGEPFMRQAMAQDLRSGFASMSIQPEPIGMGDALFQGYPIWSNAEKILVVWGDQIYVSEETMGRALTMHAGHVKTVALPLTRVTSPYVDYVFDANAHLIGVRQSREGENCASEGWADVGTFVLSVGDLLSEWRTYLNQASPGSLTQEINFLPFLPFLSARGWQIRQVQVTDSLETRGINTPEDLTFFQRRYEEMT
jgi:bifunctional UDP-N-acetylglucosamine pyrophosphorylase/glucosamine-1-phosphate N-acetyltransferase